LPARAEHGLAKSASRTLPNSEKELPDACLPAGWATAKASKNFYITYDRRATKFFLALAKIAARNFFFSEMYFLSDE